MSGDPSTCAALAAPPDSTILRAWLSRASASARSAWASASCVLSWKNCRVSGLSVVVLTRLLLLRYSTI